MVYESSQKQGDLKPPALQLGETGQQVAHRELLGGLEALSQDQAQAQNGQLADAIVEGLTPLNREKALQELRRFESLISSLAPTYTYFGIDPKVPKPEKITNVYTTDQTEQVGPFDRVGLQLTWEAYVVETLAKALAMKNRESLGDYQPAQLVEMSLFGRANKSHHIMLQRAAAQTLAPDSAEGLRLRADIDVTQLEPIGLHAGIKAEIILQTITNPSYGETYPGGGYPLSKLMEAAGIAAGPGVLSGYRFDGTRVTYDAWADIASTLLHTANAFVGTVADNHLLFPSPMERSIATNQAGLYAAHQLGVGLSDDGEFLWAISLNEVPTRVTPLMDSQTEGVWREGIIGIELCRRLAPEKFNDLQYTAKDAYAARSWIADLVHWRLGGEDTGGFADHFGSRNRFKPEFYV